MVTKTKSKRQQSIKGKLMAAVCMLLVSSIMMVSSTYAWFTLSTAPEVTGITTAVGANGNLEMALLPPSGDKNAITSGVGDSMATADKKVANITWGNLVDLSERYGLEKISLYPSQLNVTAGDAENNEPDKINQSNILSTPTYGADGRVAALVANTFTGVYDDASAFNEAAEGQGFGVRAIGTSSGMSERQIAYRGALASASTANTRAQSAASRSLNKNGSLLASMAIRHATDKENESYTKAEVEALLSIVNDLLGYDTISGDATTHTTGSLEYIEKALIQYILANTIAGSSDTNYAATKTAIEAADTTLDNVVSRGGSIPAGMSTIIDTLSDTIDSVSAAKSTLETALAQNKAAYEWNDFSSALTLLANPQTMEINTIPVKDVLTGDNMNTLVNSVLKGNGINLVMSTGAGVYADIADFCGDYSASIVIEKLAYGTLEVTDVDANMATKTNVTPIYLSQASDMVAPFTEGNGGSASTPISDFYGYIIDLAFRTNVSDSSLQLQTDAVDRVYTDNTANDATMGHGSSMTFKSSSDKFSDTSVKNLMQKIRIVFFDPEEYEVITYARLDAETSETDTDGNVTMKIKLTDANGQGDGSIAITSLEANTPKAISVLVYLDGDGLTNADVANAKESMSGTMNLQFSSSATLVPMEYSDLRNGTGSAGDLPDNDPELPEVTTTTLSAVSSADAATYTVSNATYAASDSGNAISFKLTSVADSTAITTGTASVAIDGVASPVTATYSELTGTWVADTGDAAITASTAITVTHTAA